MYCQGGYNKVWIHAADTISVYEDADKTSFRDLTILYESHQVLQMNECKLLKLAISTTKLIDHGDNWQLTSSMRREGKARL